jgi:hypothetical protein
MPIIVIHLLLSSPDDTATLLLSWEFKYSSVLQGSRGISVDNDGNVHVVGCSSNNFVVISPDGQRHRQVLSSKDGLVNPRVLDYDKATNRLLVGCFLSRNKRSNR